ncbi:zinc-binding dehydrogenase [Bacillus sp. SM2101]|uniref:quinone oxidoreductase family protein n=1 Tax=Bacillus sp. SM2101 TaxID=2805366 RepID=UPI001BDDD503|nr:zinc-binding dehydrogenase [Bacillus sp. SM2101]
MRSIVINQFGGPEVLELTDVEIPVAGPHEVLIRVEKTSVNFADIKKRKGNKGHGSFPLSIGLDVAGTVEAVGDEVERIFVGQRVIAFPSNGSYADYVVAKESLTFVLHEDIDFSTAAACPTVSILAYKLLHDIARVRKEETVLIHAAAGGVGTTAIQLAKLLGAGKVIGTVSNEAKFSVVREAGADEVMLYDGFSNKVKELTNGTGVDIVLDSIAGRITEQSLACLAKYGRLIQFGNSSGEVGHFQTSELHSSCRSVLGFSLGTTRKERPQLLEQAAKQIIRYLSNKQLTMKIGKEFPLQEVRKAHEYIESRENIGKVLLTVRG